MGWVYENPGNRKPTQVLRIIQSALRPVKLSALNKPLHVDIWVEQDDKALALELKYKTRALQTLVAEETFVLLNQSAQDVGRYDFVKDIGRVEAIVADRTWCATGYAVLLTNDPSYWRQ